MITRCLAVASLLASIPGGHAVVLDQEFMDLTSRAFELSASLFPNFQDEAQATIYTDEPDRALFIKEGNYCFVAFRGTVPTRADWEQNLDTSTSTICSPSPGPCCTARAGFVDAYNQTNYHVDLESDVRSCMSNCPDCEVVITGYSQGGAIAAVAAVALEDMDPTVITFGQPGSISGTCSHINVDKYYRFVNTIHEGRNDVEYDPVPYLNMNADQLGHLFAMSDDGDNVAYYPDGLGPRVADTIFEWDVEAHRIPRYGARLAALQSSSNMPLGIDGWDIGFPCNADDECTSPHLCVNSQCCANNQCTSPNGGPCSYDSDCGSGRCEGWFNPICKPQLGTGSDCNENSDCSSGVCSWRWKCKK